MEVGRCLCLIPIFVMGSDNFDINQYISSKEILKELI